jgi:hypothetical protein
MSQTYTCDRCEESIRPGSQRALKDWIHAEQLHLCTACSFQFSRFLRGAPLEGDATETKERPAEQSDTSEGEEEGS